MDTGEYIWGIALQLVDGTIWQLPSKDHNGDQNRHHHVMEYMRANDVTVSDVLNAEQGFTTNTGRFVNRQDAFPIAKNANQIKFMFPGGENELYSEHLWTNEVSFKI